MGKKDWRHKQHQLLHTFQVSTWVPIWYQGLFYCLHVRGEVGIMNPEDIDHGWHVHFKCVEQSLRTLINQSFMVEVKGLLLAVLVTQSPKPRPR